MILYFCVIPLKAIIGRIFRQRVMTMLAICPLATDIRKSSLGRIKLFCIHHQLPKRRLVIQPLETQIGFR
jgi:hypothetical protein